MGGHDVSDIDSVTVDVAYCHRCGTELDSHDFEGEETPWCPDCDLLLSRVPVPGVHAIVHDGQEALILDEPVPQHEGVWSLPGGVAKHDEGPRTALVRELAEETGLEADPDDLELLLVYHIDGLYLITYELDRADVVGDLTPEFEAGTVAFRSIETLRESENRLRESDRTRIETALDG